MGNGGRGRLKRLVGRLRLYWLAARLLDAYRLLVRPHIHGALVAIWHQERLLLVQASYRKAWSLPGGGLEAGETARQAAVRELAEEVGLRVEPQDLADPWQITETSRRGKDTVTIFALHADRRPVIRIDGLELVACQWLRREEVLRRPIPGHLREYLLQLT